MARDAVLVDLQHSPACAKVRICLHVKGVAYRRVAPSVRDLLRGARVPRLVGATGATAGAGAIVRRLDAERPEPSLVPAGGEARAYSDLLEGWADGALARAVRRLAWGPPEARARSARETAREIAAGPLAALLAAVLERRATRLACPAEEARATFDEHVRVLETMLAGRDFLLGRAPARADFAAVAQLARARHVAGDLGFARWPVVSAWLDRLDAVPAIATALHP
jgi:glutathione S-transferase